VVCSGFNVRDGFLYGTNRRIIKTPTPLKGVLRTSSVDVSSQPLKYLGVCINELLKIEVLHLIGARIMECTDEGCGIRNNEALLAKLFSHIPAIRHHSEDP
jgi:hypothetical protein